MSGSAGGGGGGGSGAGAGGGGGGGGGDSAASSTGATKAGPVEVIDAQGKSLGEYGQDGKPTPPNVMFTGERDGGKPKAEQTASSGPDERLQKEIDQRGSALVKNGPAEAAEAVRQDVKAVQQIKNDEVRAEALTNMGWTADANEAYRAELHRTAPRTARLAEALQGAALDGAYGGAQAANGVDDKKALMADVRSLPADNQRDREPARELVDQIARAAADSTPKTEAETVRSIERRAELHEAAYLQAKQPALDAIPKEAGQAERLAELRKRDVDVVPAETAQKWAEVDTRDFRKLQEQGRQEDAAVTMAEVARTNAAYRAALAEKSPDVAERVQTLDAANTAKVDAKDERKRVESDAMEHDKIEAIKQLSPDAAAAKAKADASAYTDEKDQTEKYYAGRDMAMAAQYNKAYRESLERVAPEVAKVVAEPNDRKAANEAIGPLREAANDQAGPVPSGTIDPMALERVAANRARDSKQAADEMGLNSLEPGVQRKQQQQLDPEADAKRSAWVSKAQPAEAEAAPSKPATSGANKVVSDEVFTAGTADSKPVIPADVEKQFLRVGDKFYHPKNTDVVAFEDKGSRLETKSNSEQVADALVAIARARGWDEIKVSGSETFRKEVWLEAASHGMQVKGYTPTEADKAELAKRSQGMPDNKVEREGAVPAATVPAAKPEVRSEASQTAAPVPAAVPAERVSTEKSRAQAFATKPAAEALKDHPELAGTYAAVASVEKQVEADNLTPEQRKVVMARVKQNAVNAIERGDVPAVNLRENAEVRQERATDKELSR